jgi:predicted RND superfamily exporter protein
MITLLMVFLFRSFSIFLATMIPNIIPLILTAGIMGYFKIPLKPSTVMIFGIALGITVNDTILLLGKLKQKIKENPTISRIEALMQALEESALAMAYTSIILIFGFIMFVFSNFLGTQALGLLISITLLIGMFTNLILLPSLMLSFHKKMNYQRLIESEVFNDEDDYDEDKLELEKPKE